jgi:hypothetical protein
MAITHATRSSSGRDSTRAGAQKVRKLMSTATLNCWITEIGDPCHIINHDEWFVHIVDCEGKVLTWCGKTYRDIPTKCGHAEIEIPPGCYAVFAGHSTKGTGIGEFGNRLTHVQIVRANCGDHVCVTLFSPSLWYCGTWFKAAIKQQAAGLKKAGVDDKTAKAAVDAVQNVLGKLRCDTFTQNLEVFQTE